MKPPIIIVTGCSHTAGNEYFESVHLEDYNKLLEQSNSETQFYKIKQSIQIKQKYIIQKLLKKDKKQIIANPKKLLDLTSRYFKLVQRRYSWPSKLQEMLGDEYEVINLSEQGGSFKLSVSRIADFLKNKKISNFIAIHQVPAISRTYIKYKKQKHNIAAGDAGTFQISKLFAKSQEYQETHETLKNRYNNLIRRDVSSDYFNKVRDRQYDFLKKISKEKNIDNYFITEDIKQSSIFPKESLILNDFNTFRKKYKRGIHGHVIDPLYQKELSDLVISKVLKKNTIKSTT